ncbi:MAG TPA: phenylalanine--tRNA ligase subunit beta, partial [Rhodothermales bacterium]|nr:phenylalanine--tRNA ligase subunit beta [Rhodothermales bacterium]
HSHGRSVLRFMEFGHVFRRTDRRGTLVPGYSERELLTLTVAGPHTEAAWDTTPRPADFFDLKGALESFLDALHFPGVVFEPSEQRTPVAAYYARMRAGEVDLGALGRLSDQTAGDYGIKEPVYFAELDWGALTTLASPAWRRRYTPVNRFPVVERDLAVVVDRDAPVGALMASIQESGDTLLQEVAVFDIYRGNEIGEGKKSVAFSLRFGADRTLRDQEVDARMAAVIKRLEKEHHAQLRT